VYLLARQQKRLAWWDCTQCCCTCASNTVGFLIIWKGWELAFHSKQEVESSEFSQLQNTLEKDETTSNSYYQFFFPSRQEAKLLIPFFLTFDYPDIVCPSKNSSFQKHSSDIPVASCLVAVILFLPFCIFLERSAEKLNNQQGSQANFGFIAFFCMYYVCRSYKTEQWRGKNGCDIFLFHLSKCRVPASFTNDILRLGAETFSQLTVRLKTAAKNWWLCEVESQAELAMCTMTNLRPSCTWWVTFELTNKVLGRYLCASRGSFWRLIAVVSNEFVCISGWFLMILQTEKQSSWSFIYSQW
jgi:hypothetical protein